MGNMNNGNGGLVCAHCRQYGFECTFFLPITETRFKKKYQREAEEAAAAAAAVAAASGANGVMRAHAYACRAYGVGHPAYPGMMVAQPYMGALHNPTGFHAMQSGMSQQAWGTRVVPQQTQSSHFPRGSSQQLTGLPQPQQQLQHSNSAPTVPMIPQRRSPSHTPPPDTRVLGPTSIAYIVHSTAFIPGAAIEAHDIKHNQTFEVGASGDGIIRFHRARRIAGADADKSATPTAADLDEEEVTRIPESIKGRLAGDVAESGQHLF